MYTDRCLQRVTEAKTTEGKEQIRGSCAHNTGNTLSFVHTRGKRLEGRVRQKETEGCLQLGSRERDTLETVFFYTVRIFFVSVSIVIMILKSR